MWRDIGFEQQIVQGVAIKLTNAYSLLDVL